MYLLYEGATQMTNHMGSPQIANSNASEHLNHLNMRSSSRSPKFDDEEKEDSMNGNGNGDRNGNRNRNGNKNGNGNGVQSNGRNSLQSHFRRKSSFSMSCHYRNIDSLQNISNLDSMLWEDENLPSDYSLGKRKKLTNSGIIRNMEQDPKERRFKLDRWLYPIFLDFHDETTTEIIQGKLFIYSSTNCIQIYPFSVPILNQPQYHISYYRPSSMGINSMDTR